MTLAAKHYHAKELADSLNVAYWMRNVGGAQDRYHLKVSRRRLIKILTPGEASADEAEDRKRLLVGMIEAYNKGQGMAGVLDYLLDNVAPLPVERDDDA